MTNNLNDAKQFALSFESGTSPKRRGRYAIRDSQGKLVYAFHIIQDGSYFQIYTSPSEFNLGSPYPNSIREHFSDSRLLARGYAQEKLRTFSLRQGVPVDDTACEDDFSHSLEERVHVTSERVLV